MSAATATAAAPATGPDATHVSHLPPAPTPEQKDFAAYLGGLEAHGGVDLHVELKEAKRQVSDHGGYAILTQALGIPRTAIVEAGGLGLLRVTTVRENEDAPIESRYFVPASAEDKNSQLALIVPVWNDQGGDLVDLLAVRTDQPSRFFVRNGYARCLGEWNAAEVRNATTLWALPDDVHPSLVLSPNPLTWLRGDCAGVCILHKAYLGSVLTGIRSVVAHNERHAAALHKLLTWPGAPEIFFHQKKKHEAA